MSMLCPILVKCRSTRVLPHRRQDLVGSGPVVSLNAPLHNMADQQGVFRTDYIVVNSSGTCEHISQMMSVRHHHALVILVESSLLPFSEKTIL